MQFRVVFGHPVADGPVEFLQMPGKEMIRVLHENDPRASRNASDNLLHLFPRSVFVERALHDKLWLVASFEVSELRAVYGNAEADEFPHAWVSASHAEPDPAAKAEAAEQERPAGKLLGEKIHRSLNVSTLADTAIVPAQTQAGAAKIKT